MEDNSNDRNVMITARELCQPLLCIPDGVLRHPRVHVLDGNRHKERWRRGDDRSDPDVADAYPAYPSFLRNILIFCAYTSQYKLATVATSLLTALPVMKNMCVCAASYIHRSWLWFTLILDNIRVLLI